MEVRLNPSPRTLPARADADQLRRQAKELLRGWRAEDAAALARAAGHRLHSPPRLTDAQHVIARELGQPSWPKLMQATELQQAAALSDADFERRVLTLVLGAGWDVPQPQRALALLATRRVESLALALVQGDLVAVQHALTPAHVNQPLGPLNAPPLAYAAASSLARVDAHRSGLVATVCWLLAQDADPNTRWPDPARPDERMPVLYGAVSRATCYETVQTLLDAGADPNDQESLYHATEQSDRRIIAALVQAGARWQGTNALYRQLDHDDLEGLRQVLSLGADVREPGPGGANPLHHAILRGRSAAFVELLLAHGADASQRGAHGHTPAELAALLGDTDTVALLAARGHGTPQDPQSRFLAACAAADEAAARAHLAEVPDAVRRLAPQALRLLPDQAQRGRLASVRLMLALGWPVAAVGDWQATALNQAAFRGDAAMVRLLLGHGARWHEKNGFGGEALGSCLHAATNQPDPAGDYAAVFAMLLADGAPVPEDVDDQPDALQAMLPT